MHLWLKNHKTQPRRWVGRMLDSETIESESTWSQAILKNTVISDLGIISISTNNASSNLYRQINLWKTNTIASTRYSISSRETDGEKLDQFITCKGGMLSAANNNILASLMSWWELNTHWTKRFGSQLWLMNRAILPTDPASIQNSGTSSFFSSVFPRASACSNTSPSRRYQTEWRKTTLDSAQRHSKIMK